MCITVHPDESFSCPDASRHFSNHRCITMSKTHRSTSLLVLVGAVMSLGASAANMSFRENPASAVAYGVVSDLAGAAEAEGVKSIRRRHLQGQFVLHSPVEESAFTSTLALPILGV